MNWQKGVRWFLAEFLVVVVGVLVAVALNAWYQSGLDTASERSYLTFLSRDLQRAVQDLEEQVRFEDLQIKDGIDVDRALSSADRPQDTMALSAAMGRLGTRKTMTLKNSTYEDLISTGNFHLIRDVGLRDHIAEFYQATGLQFEITNKNNAFFVDEMYTANVLLSGLVLSRPGSNHPTLNASDAMLADDLRGGYVDRPDALWELATDAPQWAMVRSNLLARLPNCIPRAYRCERKSRSSASLEG